MELCYLDFELFPKDSLDQSSDKVIHQPENQEPLCRSGNVQYDPNEKGLIFYDFDTKFMFTIPLASIVIKLDYLNQNKIVFDYQKNNTLYQIDIFNNKKETLGECTLKLLVNKFYQLQLKFDQKQNKPLKQKYVIQTPKQYQLEILEEAKKHNVIVFLETGLGKTYIAILMIKSIFNEPIQANRFNRLIYTKKSTKKVLCLFKTVSLLLQQAKVIKNNSNLKILKLYGNSENSRLYLHSKFKKIIEKNDIICATPESIYRCFTFGYLSPDELELIVIDECHHARENDFYNLILKHFIFSNEVNRNKIKILGLTASPCAEKVSKEENIYDSIVSLCHNLNSHLACPSNIINKPQQQNVISSNNTLKEAIIHHKTITFLKLNEKNEDKIESIKLFIFHQLILPILDWYLTIILKKGQIHQDEKFIDSNNESIKSNPLKKKEKKALQLYLTTYFLSHYLTLKCDETKLEEKFMGLYTKTDITDLSAYLAYFSNNESSSNFTWITQDSIKEMISKLSSYEVRDESDKINISFEMREFIKEYKTDSILQEIKKYSKSINLIIKYLDIESIYYFSSNCFGNIEKIFFQVYKNMYFVSANINTSYLDCFNQLLLPIKKIMAINDYTSSYLSSLIKFLEDKNHINDKTILFVDQRNICNAFNRKVNNILQKNGLTSRYVIGIASSGSSINFTEKELKENLDFFRSNNKCKLLIATNVVEEGIDVPQCNNIICLSEIKTIKEYIQKTGRARIENSRLLLFSNAEDEQSKIDNLKQIELSLKVMKEIIYNRNIKPKIPQETYIRNYHYFETIKGARVYLSYAQKIIDEFISKLFNDGYTFVHAEGKEEDTKPLLKDKNSKSYRPYLSLPSVLESSFSKVYDNNLSLEFPTKESARTYFNQYKPHFFLKAVKILYNNLYLDEFLQFNKNYDDLISIENNFLKCECEKRIKIKQSPYPQIDCDLIKFTAHLLLFQPNYFDINYNEKNQKYVCLLSDKPLAMINFDLFIPSNLLLKLYYLNTNFQLSESSEDNINGIPKWFLKKPIIPYTIFSKMNIAMDRYFTIKVPKERMDLINFFFTYSLFLATDAEMFFYHSIYTKKFSFGDKLFSNHEIQAQLSFIFKHYDENYLNSKQHLKAFSLSKLNYESHLVKFSIIKYDITKDDYSIDFDFIIKCYKCVIEEIENYYKYIKRCLQSEEDRKRLLIDEAFLKDKEEILFQELENDESFKDPDVGTICRNMLNFSKMILMRWGGTDIRGTSNHLKHRDQTYQKYFIDHYGILTRSNKDFKKCLELDYNMKIMRYKINIKNLGEVKKKFNHLIYAKKFHFFPNETLQMVELCTIDQLHVFTLFPVILFKVQNSLIYYYHTYLLMNKFTRTFNRFETINIKLISSGLNSKSTMELENYERLEFLGDAILKLMSSIEVFIQYPNANRDLLFSKRRVIENNKSLFEKGKENELYQYLFTNPITLKRVIIPGFTHDESLIFDISCNRAFTKNCYMHKRKILGDSNNDENKDNSIEKEGSTKNNEQKGINTNELPSIQEENEMENEKKNERTTIEVDYTNENAEIVTLPEISLPVTRELIEDVVNNKIEIINSKRFRFIYTKTLADLVESLIGFYFHSSLDNKYSIDEAIQSSCIFMNELSILTSSFIDNLSDNWKVSLKDLKNSDCKFTSEQQYHYMRNILDNQKYKFKNCELLYQAMTHPTVLTDEKKADNFNYVNKSYQRLAFLGEAVVFLYVSLFVYMNNPFENESTLHKMRICGINHHIISLIAIDDLKLNDCLLKAGGDLNNDISNYKTKLKNIRSSQENKYKITDEAVLDESFVVVLCELFHSYIGAILLDSKSVKTTFEILDKIMLEYLKNNATRDTYTEHPKVTILEEFNRKRQYFKRIRENGGNRIMMKFGQKKEEKFRKQKLYDYQLIIDKFVIYEEAIAYNRSTIKIAQEKAKNVFLEICKELERREKLRLHLSKFDLQNILNYLGIKYKKLN